LSLVRSERRGAVALITLDRPGANAFHAELVQELRGHLRQTRGAGAVVLTSALPGFFSAGWDLPALARFSRKEMSSFYKAYCDLVREIFGLEAPVVAALPGHAIAGGLIVAAAADERYAAEGRGEFGLSEVRLGVPVPRCCFEIFRYAIGGHAAERLASSGENLSAAEVLRIGLVDAIGPAEDLLERAVERATRLAAVSAPAHAAIKSNARAGALASYDSARKTDSFLDLWFGEDAQQRIRALVERLNKKT